MVQDRQDTQTVHATYASVKDVSSGAPPSGGRIAREQPTEKRGKREERQKRKEKRERREKRVGHTVGVGEGSAVDGGGEEWKGRCRGMAREGGRRTAKMRRLMS